ncbi:hypothetical protein C5Y93_11005 [Blastopirellula marina]|uniref:Uncharacterized protein n=2 Tax=Blastopirellula marina TaxID=124 RepID=A0A2S8GNS3_9BACT|nr:hypothetical protein C5Y93_11005 [Blastopirellula marina]
MVDAYLQEAHAGNATRLSTQDFRGTVSLRFPDGSFALFRHAFYLVSEELSEIALFTEHCGYHVFPRYDTQVEMLETTSLEDFRVG